MVRPGSLTLIPERRCYICSKRIRNCILSVSVFSLAICIDVFAGFFLFFWGGSFGLRHNCGLRRFDNNNQCFCYKREFITAAAVARRAEGAAAAWRLVSNEQAWPVSVHCARWRVQTQTFTLAIDLWHSYTLFKETFAAAVTNGCQASAKNIHLLSTLILQVAPGPVPSLGRLHPRQITPILTFTPIGHTSEYGLEHRDSHTSPWLAPPWRHDKYDSVNFLVPVGMAFQRLAQGLLCETLTARGGLSLFRALPPQPRS